jgi:hypothetical protein
VQLQRQLGISRYEKAWYLLHKLRRAMIAAGRGLLANYGDPIAASRARRIARAFQPPLCFAQIHTARFYDDAGNGPPWPRTLGPAWLRRWPRLLRR